MCSRALWSCRWWYQCCNFTNGGPRNWEASLDSAGSGGGEGGDGATCTGTQSVLSVALGGELQTLEEGKSLPYKGEGDEGDEGEGESEASDCGFMLSVQGLSYSTPDGGRQLARELTFMVREGHGVVIRGPSGCGKSSLVRCLAGLWSPDAGSMSVPPGCRLLVMPQK